MLGFLLKLCRRAGIVGAPPEDIAYCEFECTERVCRLDCNGRCLVRQDAERRKMDRWPELANRSDGGYDHDHLLKPVPGFDRRLVSLGVARWSRNPWAARGAVGRFQGGRGVGSFHEAAEAVSDVCRGMVDGRS